MQRAIGDKSLICVPLFQGPHVVGALNVMSSATGRKLTEDDRRTIEMLSVVLSAAVSSAAEIEARRAQTEALARLRLLFDGASIGIVRSNREGIVVEVNPAVEEMLGYSARRARRRELPQLHAPATTSTTASRVRRDDGRAAGHATRSSGATTARTAP